MSELTFTVHADALAVLVLVILASINAAVIGATLADRYPVSRFVFFGLVAGWFWWVGLLVTVII